MIKHVSYRSGPAGQISFFGGYNLAIRRACSHASALAVAQMVTGDEFHGNIKAKNSIILFEHRCATAKGPGYVEYSWDDPGASW